MSNERDNVIDTYTNPEGHVVRVIAEGRSKRLGVGRAPIVGTKNSTKSMSGHIAYLDEEHARIKDINQGELSEGLDVDLTEPSQPLSSADTLPQQQSE